MNISKKNYKKCKTRRLKNTKKKTNIQDSVSKSTSFDCIKLYFLRKFLYVKKNEHKYYNNNNMMN